MTIQRQYSLPNCKLILEGLGDEAMSVSPTTGRPLVSIVVNAECHFIGCEKSLSGGREFLESLVTAASQYAQECLSGIPRPPLYSTSKMVQIHKIAPNLHRLRYDPKPEHTGNVNGHGEVVQLDLRTLQIFDLVEAVDQLFADAQTLPDLTLKLSPLAKRYVVSQEPLLKRATPVAIGFSGLAAAAIALFFLPVPEVRKPEPEPAAQESPTSPTPVASGTPLPSPTSTPAETPDDVSPSPEPIESSETESPDAANVSPTDAQASLETLLNSAPEITDPETIDQLTETLRDEVSSAWERENLTFSEDLVYRVGVAENGDILGFKQTDQAAIDYTDETPLLGLLYQPVDAAANRQEPIAEFRVVFRPNGVVEVSPWRGRVIE
jgi:Domain of unknown function (DUF4335)